MTNLPMETAPAMALCVLSRPSWRPRHSGKKKPRCEPAQRAAVYSIDGLIALVACNSKTLAPSNKTQTLGRR